MAQMPDLETVLSRLERSTLDLARCVRHRDPAFAGHSHARAEALRALEDCSFDLAGTGHLTRLRAVSRLGTAVEQSIRQWRSSIVSEMNSIGAQRGLARLAGEREPAGSILDMAI